MNFRPSSKRTMCSVSWSSAVPEPRRTDLRPESRVELRSASALLAKPLPDDAGRIERGFMERGLERQLDRLGVWSGVKPRGINDVQPRFFPGQKDRHRSMTGVGNHDANDDVPKSRQEMPQSDSVLTGSRLGGRRTGPVACQSFPPWLPPSFASLLKMSRPQPKLSAGVQHDRCCAPINCNSLAPSRSLLKPVIFPTFSQRTPKFRDSSTALASSWSRFPTCHVRRPPSQSHVPCLSLLQRAGQSTWPV